MNFRQWFNKLVSEDSIENIGFEGDWSSGAKRRGWDRPSIGILQSEKGIEKLKTRWQKTEYPFDLWFVRSPKGWKYTEVGKVDLAFIRTKLGLEIPINDEHITVIYTNNKGSEKMPATPWTLAHRFGHAIRMDNTEYQQLNIVIDKLIEDVAQKVYNQNVKNELYSFDRFKPDQKNRIKLQVAHALGTFKSARDRNLRNVGEFTNELVAQYIVSGKIKFNRELPNILATRYTWGYPQGPWKKNSPELIDELDTILSHAETDIYWRIDAMVGAAVGNIYVM